MARWTEAAPPIHQECRSAVRRDQRERRDVELLRGASPPATSLTTVRSTRGGGRSVGPGRRISRVSGGELLIILVLSLVWAWFGYRLSENDRRTLGRTPWGIPSVIWALFWFISLILGLVLYLIAHATGVRRGAAAARRPPGRCDGRRPPERRRAVPRLPAAGQLERHSTRTGRVRRGNHPGHRCLARFRRDRRDAGGVAACLASRPERPLPVPLVGRQPVDVARRDQRTGHDRHQPGPADRALLRGASRRPASTRRADPAPHGVGVLRWRHPPPGCRLGRGAPSDRRSANTRARSGRDEQ